MIKFQGKGRKGLIIIGLLILMLAVGCSSANLKVGYVSTGIGNAFTASYYYFDGVETRSIDGEPGETIIVAYNSEVKRGNLEMKIKAPTGEIYSLTSDGDSEESIEIPVNKTGTYRLMVVGEKTRGSFSVSWSAI